MSQVNDYESTVKEIFKKIYQELIRLRSSPRIGAKHSDKTNIDSGYRYIVSGKSLIFYKMFKNKNMDAFTLTIMAKELPHQIQFELRLSGPLFYFHEICGEMSFKSVVFSVFHGGNNQWT